jgi:hypothetical protein
MKWAVLYVIFIFVVAWAGFHLGDDIFNMIYKR